MVFVACKTVWSMPECFKVVCIPCKALYTCSALLYFTLGENGVIRGQWSDFQTFPFHPVPVVVFQGRVKCDWGRVAYNNSLGEWIEIWRKSEFWGSGRYGPPYAYSLHCIKRTCILYKLFCLQQSPQQPCSWWRRNGRERHLTLSLAATNLIMNNNNVSSAARLPWMTLNGVIALILCFSPNSIASQWLKIDLLCP